MHEFSVGQGNRSVCVYCLHGHFALIGQIMQPNRRELPHCCIASHSQTCPHRCNLGNACTAKCMWSPTDPQVVARKHGNASQLGTSYYFLLRFTTCSYGFALSSFCITCSYLCNFCSAHVHICSMLSNVFECFRVCLSVLKVGEGWRRWEKARES